MIEQRSKERMTIDMDTKQERPKIAQISETVIEGYAKSADARAEREVKLT